MHKSLPQDAPSSSLNCPINKVIVTLPDQRTRELRETRFLEPLSRGVEQQEVGGKDTTGSTARKKNYNHYKGLLE